MSTETIADTESSSIEHTCELDELLLTDFRLWFGTHYEQNIDGWFVGSANIVGIAPQSQQTFCDTPIDAWNDSVTEIEYEKTDRVVSEVFYHSHTVRSIIDQNIIEQIASFLQCTADDVEAKMSLHSSADNNPVLVSAGEYRLMIAPRF